MSYNNKGLVQDLDKASQARKRLANILNQMLNNLTQAESLGNKSSGKLGLQNDIKSLSIEIDKLNKGVFRLLVLGEMKRGKSTFLNALLGEKDLLPTAVNPCTAILTILRYGKNNKVTVYFNDGKKPATLDFNTFKERYTIKAEEATKLEKQNKKAFPDVDYAVVEYPLEILSKGVEIVDSPGLNDTKERDAITLDYIAKCHAILYVLSATQQFNQNERDYLRSRIQGRGLAVFFLINCWDEIRSKLFDPEDRKEVADAKKDIRNRFAPIISDYLQSENKTNEYEKWVFEISSLNALRCRIKNQPLDSTGFPELEKTLGNFLTSDRLKVELSTAVITSESTAEKVQKAIQRRIPLLGERVEKLEQKIRSVQPLFDKLTRIRDEFEGEITESQQNSARRISQSFKDYFNNLTKTFDLDFIEYEPELKDNSETERKKFLEAIQKAFRNYLENKVSDWNKQQGEPILKDALLRLANSTNIYIPSYIQTTNQITTVLLKDQTDVNLIASPNSPNVSSNMNVSGIRHGNISDVKGIGGGIAGSVAGVFGGSYIGGLASIGLTALLPHIGTGLLLTGFLAPVGLLAILGGIWGAREARKDHYISEVKRKLKEEIPKIATEKARSIYSNVSDGFRDSLKIIQQMDDDITSQKEQLNNLLEQKRKNHIDTESEKKRLADLENTVTNLSQQAVRFYNQF